MSSEPPDIVVFFWCCTLRHGGLSMEWTTGAVHQDGASSEDVFPFLRSTLTAFSRPGGFGVTLWFSWTAGVPYGNFTVRAKRESGHTIRRRSTCSTLNRALSLVSVLVRMHLCRFFVAISSQVCAVTASSLKVVCRES